jgi:hypothetical protein
MKDLILNFSWDRLLSLPPTEFLAFVVLTLLVLIPACAIIFILLAIAADIKIGKS